MTDEKKRSPKVHELKCWPGDFEAIRTAKLTADLRRSDDRDFRVGDILVEREYDPQTQAYSGRVLRLRISRVDRMAGPRILCGVGQVGADDVLPIVMLSFHDERLVT